MKRTVLFLGALLAFFVASPATAQTLYVHGGADFPSSSEFNDAYKTGFNVGIGGGLALTENIEGVLMGRYDRFGLDLPGDFDGGAFSTLSATANLKLNGPMMSRRITPYAFGGGGIFRSAVGDLESNGVTAESDSEVDFGLQFGAGLSVGMTPRTSLLVEPNYVVILNEGENTQYFPVRLGVSLGL
jgi:opacity protein-like surface antigen